MRVTNANFAKDERFKLACQVMKVLPTKRQASKYRRRMGLTFKATQAQINQQIINNSWRD